MARIVSHETIMMNGDRTPANGTKGKVFAYREYISGEIIFILCAMHIEWRHLKVYPRDVKLTSGTFSVSKEIVRIELDRSVDGWPTPYELENLREELELAAVVLCLSRKQKV